MRLIRCINAIIIIIIKRICFLCKYNNYTTIPFKLKHHKLIYTGVIAICIEIAYILRRLLYMFWLY